MSRSFILPLSLRDSPPTRSPGLQHHDFLRKSSGGRKTKTVTSSRADNNVPTNPGRASSSQEKVRFLNGLLLVRLAGGKRDMSTPAAEDEKHSEYVCRDDKVAALVPDFIFTPPSPSSKPQREPLPAVLTSVVSPESTIPSESLLSLDMARSSGRSKNTLRGPSLSPETPGGSLLPETLGNCVQPMLWAEPLGDVIDPILSPSRRGSPILSKETPSASSPEIPSAAIASLSARTCRGSLRYNLSTDTVGNSLSVTVTPSSRVSSLFSTNSSRSSVDSGLSSTTADRYTDYRVTRFHELTNSMSSAESEWYEAQWAASAFLRKFIENRWKKHRDHVRIDWGVTIWELRRIGELGREDGVRECRRLVRAPVIHDEVAIALYEDLARRVGAGEGVALPDEEGLYLGENLEDGNWEFAEKEEREMPEVDIYECRCVHEGTKVHIPEGGGSLDVPWSSLSSVSSGSRRSSTTAVCSEEDSRRSSAASSIATLYSSDSQTSGDFCLGSSDKKQKKPDRTWSPVCVFCPPGTRTTCYIPEDFKVPRWQMESLLESATESSRARLCSGYSTVLRTVAEEAPQIATGELPGVQARIQEALKGSIWRAPEPYQPRGNLPYDENAGLIARFKKTSAEDPGMCAEAITVTSTETKEDAKRGRLSRRMHNMKDRLRSTSRRGSKNKDGSRGSVKVTVR